MRAAIYAAAEGYLGLKEWPGAKHNPEIVKLYADAGHGWVQDDETPWCAAFVAAVLAQLGLQGTGKLTARSYLQWGEPVDLDDAEPGDIVVFWRGSPDGWQGHVAFFDSLAAGAVRVLGGNQGDAVSIASYPKGRLLGVRRLAAAPRGAPEPAERPKASKSVAAAWAAVGVAIAAFGASIINWFGG